MKTEKVVDMGFWSRLLGRIKQMLFFLNSGNEIEKAFGVRLVTSPEMDSAMMRWDTVSSGKPPWLDSEDDVETVNMAKHIADFRAKLTSLDIDITVSGSERADYLQDIADQMLARLPDSLCEADRLGGMMIKWNGKSWDFVMPGNFGVTDMDNNKHVTGAIFAAHTVQGSSHFTRLEYHRFEKTGSGEEEGRLYRISNKCFKNRVSAGNITSLGDEVKLTSVTEWQHIQPETYIRNLEHPLFAYYRVPGVNIVDTASPFGMSVFANAMTELKAIDIGISRKNAEVEDSRHITFVGQQLVKNAQGKGIKLPRFVKGLGIGLNDTETSSIHEHTPTMLTEERIKDINFNLSMAGVKCGFSAGVFVLDGKTGMITATQVEADDRDTIQTIKTDRDALKTAIEQAFYGADAMASLYGAAPIGSYELNFSFGDITYNYEEDKASWKYYVAQGWVPKWLFLVKFEGMAEEEAKALVAEAEPKQNTLFALEE